MEAIERLVKKPYFFPAQFITRLNLVAVYFCFNILYTWGCWYLCCIAYFSKCIKTGDALYN